MLNIEVGRRRANRFYDPCRLCVRCTAAGRAGWDAFLWPTSGGRRRGVELTALRAAHRPS